MTIDAPTLIDPERMVRRATPKGVAAAMALGRFVRHASAIRAPAPQAWNWTLRLPDGTLVGVQHWDIKSQNVSLSGGSVRLADFGLAKSLRDSAASHSGAMFPHYVAPETFGGKLTTESDQYSFFIMYFSLQIGQYDFEGSFEQIILGHETWHPDISGFQDGPREVMARALAKDPQWRWKSCSRFVEKLRSSWTTQGLGEARPEGVVHGVPLAGSVDSRSGKIATEDFALSLDRTGRRGRTAAIVACVGAVGLIAALVTGLSRGGRGDRPDSNRGVALDNAPGRAAAESGSPSGLLVAAITSPDPGGDGREEGPADVSDVKDDPSAPAGLAGGPTDPEIAQQGVAFLKEFCHRCHGVEFDVREFDVLDRPTLVTAPPAGGKRDLAYVAPGDPASSLIWQRAGVDFDMPPFDEEPSPTDENLDRFRAWIVAGAPFPEASADVDRPTIDPRAIMGALHDDLEATPAEARPFRRYFSLAERHNRRDVTDGELRLSRAALSKLLNSLSWERRIVVPETVGDYQTLLAVDLRDLGWDASSWNLILRGGEAESGGVDARPYPYGLTFDRSQDPDLRRRAEDVYRMSGTNVPYVRVDWFVANASRPPIYHDLLRLPEHLGTLEDRLNIDVRENFRLDRLARAGFASSGVSGHNRLVERHEASFGAYWKSYDFNSDEGRGSLPKFPLGPEFQGNPYERQAFDHAGGEIIFNLPNGLQGYMLVDAEERAIAVAPTDIVSDKLRVSGTAAIVNGLSCIACHDEGMKSEFTDEIREGHALSGKSLLKVQRLYPPREEMERYLAEDRERFLDALEAATGRFLKVGPDSGQPIESFEEPVGALALRHAIRPLDLSGAAAELGIAEPDRLRGIIRANPDLRRLGLGPLLQEGGEVRREAWESLQTGYSPYQRAASILELGIPHREL